MNCEDVHSIRSCLTRSHTDTCSTQCQNVLGVFALSMAALSLLYEDNVFAHFIFLNCA